VAGATVATGPARPSLSAVTDAAGAFLIGLEGAGPFTLTCTATGFVSCEVQGVWPGARPVLVLYPAAEIVVAVRDAQSQAAVIGAEVIASGGRSVRTDTAGMATLRDIVQTDGYALLMVRSVDHAPRSEVIDLRRLDPRVAVEVFVSPGLTLQGRVQDDDGRPLAGVDLDAEQLGETVRVASDASGCFELGHISEDELLTIRIADERFVRRKYRVRPRETSRELVLTASTGEVCEMVAQEANGEPVIGARLLVDGQPERAQFTNAAGRAQVRIAADDKALLVLTDLAPAGLIPCDRLSARSETTVSLAPRRAIRVFLLDEATGEGAGPGVVTVRAQSRNTPTMPAWEWPISVSAAGGFTVSVVPSAFEYAVLVRMPGVRGIWHDLPPPMDDPVTLRLDRQCSVSLQAKLESGVPVPQELRLTLTDTSQGIEQRLSIEGQLHGSFTVPGGLYDYSVDAAGFRPAQGVLDLRQVREGQISVKLFRE